MNKKVQEESRESFIEDLDMALDFACYQLAGVDGFKKSANEIRSELLDLALSIRIKEGK